MTPYFNVIIVTIEKHYFNYRLNRAMTVVSSSLQKSLSVCCFGESARVPAKNQSELEINSKLKHLLTLFIIVSFVALFSWLRKIDDDKYFGEFFN